VTLPTAIATGRVNIAFDDDALEPSPTWTRLDDTANLVASYSIDRGRQFELDRTDGGSATVVINDIDGVLDPTNTTGPFYTKIEPLLQITLGRFNPVANEWQTRFRGFISEYDYSFNPAQNVNQLTLSCVDLFEILQAIDMLPGQFGDTPPAGSEGQVVFNVFPNVDDRINQVYGNANLPTAFYVTFTGNVTVSPTVYSSGESAMTAVQELVDAEFPGVSNLYTDRFGRVVFHGRLAKFDPATTAAGAGDEAWDWHHWHAGDHAAVVASPSTVAQLRQFAMNRGLSKIINNAIATPIGIADTDVAGQIVQDLTSIGLRGYRSWSAMNLLTSGGLLDATDANDATKQFATYYVENYAEARNRVPLCGFRSIDPRTPGAAAVWNLIAKIDISDQIDFTVAAPGGGGFTAEPFFVEGIHETNMPANGTYDDVTVTLDVSPQAYFTTNPFPTT
jgi:hypothetical protein